MKKKIKMILQGIMGDLVNGEFKRIEEMTNGVRLSAVEMEMAVSRLLKNGDLHCGLV